MIDRNSRMDRDSIAPGSARARGRGHGVTAVLGAGDHGGVVWTGHDS